MRLSTRLVQGALVAALLVPAVAKADVYSRSWTVCGTSGSFKSCHSVSLATFWDGSNTHVTVSVMNLNGSTLGNTLGDNMPTSGLFFLRFYGQSANIGTHGGGVGDLTTATGGSSGTAAPWGWSTANNTGADANTYGVLKLDGNTGGARRIGGCVTIPASPATNTPVVASCGTAVVMTFSVGANFNAGQLDGMNFQARANGSGGTPNVQCYTNQNYATAGGACSYDNASPVTVTPEPMSIALLSTGLIGLTGVGLRRRKKNNEIGE